MRLTVGATRADSSSPSIPREKQHSQLLRPICALLLLLATAGTIVQATGAHERQAARVLSPTRGHATSRGGGGGGATSSGAAVAIAVTRQQPQQRQQHAATSGNVAVANNRERVRKIDLICQKIRRKAEWAELFRRTSGKQRPNVPPQLDVFITENFDFHQMLVGKGMQGCVTLVAYAATPQAMRNYNKYVRGIHDGNYGMPHPVRKFDPPEKQKHFYALKTMLDPPSSSDPALIAVVQRRFAERKHFQPKSVPIELAIGMAVYDPRTPRTINYFDYYEDQLTLARAAYKNQIVVMVEEYFPSKSIYDFVADRMREPMTEESLRDMERESICIMLQIAEGIQQIHSKNYAHMDLSPENIMIRELSNEERMRALSLDNLHSCHHEVRIIDFGLAVSNAGQVDRTAYLNGINQIFAAPEVLETREQVDTMWKKRQSGDRYKHDMGSLCEQFCSNLRVLFLDSPLAMRGIQKLRSAMENSCLMFSLTGECTTEQLKPFMDMVYSPTGSRVRNSLADVVRSALSRLTSAHVVDARPADMYAIGMVARILFLEIDLLAASASRESRWYDNFNPAEPFVQASLRADGQDDDDITWPSMGDRLRRAWETRYAGLDGVEMPREFASIVDKLVVVDPLERLTAEDLVPMLEQLWSRFDGTRMRDRAIQKLRNAPPKHGK